MIDLNKLEALATAASPGPWRGDRIDGTVKYSLLDANDNAVINGDNGNSDHGPYGIAEENDENYLMAAHPAAVMELIALIRRQEAELKAERASTATLTESMRTLALAIWRDNYKADSPQFEVLPDAAGILSQIDNMVCGMARAALPATGAVTDTRAAFEASVLKRNVAYDDPSLLLVRNLKGDYSTVRIEGEWQGWQAAIAAQPQAVAAPDAQAAPAPTTLSDEQIDHHIDEILLSAGTAMRHYSMQKSKDDMRAAMRAALAAAGNSQSPAAPAAVAAAQNWKLVPLEPDHAILKAMAESRAVDDEGQFPLMLDLLDFSGENKTHAALRAAYVAALVAAPVGGSHG